MGFHDVMFCHDIGSQLWPIFDSAIQKSIVFLFDKWNDGEVFIYLFIYLFSSYSFVSPTQLQYATYSF